MANPSRVHSAGSLAKAPAPGRTTRIAACSAAPLGEKPGGVQSLATAAGAVVSFEPPETPATQPKSCNAARQYQRVAARFLHIARSPATIEPSALMTFDLGIFRSNRAGAWPHRPGEPSGGAL